jgi:AraC-like DNA-binding protein
VTSSLQRGGASAQTVLRTQDKQEAEAAVAKSFLPNRLEPLTARGLDVRLDALRLGSTTVGRLSYGADTRLSTADASHYHVNVPMRGRAVSRSGTGDSTVAMPGQAAVFQPDHPAEILWLNGCVQVCLMIPRVALESELEQLVGRSLRGPVVFEPVMDLSSPTARGWRESLNVFLTEFDAGPGLTSHPTVGRQLERMIVDGLLLSHRHNYSDAVQGSGGVVPSGTVRRGTALLEAHPEHPWSTAALARQMHVSVRSLQEAFTRDIGVPPMRYLREVRLRRAHELLRAAAPGTTTVGAVACEVGFAHLGRFSAAYRGMFGEPPSSTLRTGQGAADKSRDNGRQRHTT